MSISSQAPQPKYIGQVGYGTKPQHYNAYIVGPEIASTASPLPNALAVHAGKAEAVRERVQHLLNAHAFGDETPKEMRINEQGLIQTGAQEFTASHVYIIRNSD